MYIFLKHEDREKRKLICDSCENKKGVRCGVCGCFLIALQKVKHMNCPAGKWGELNSQEEILKEHK